MCGVPQTHNEVLKSPEALRWKCAMKEEIDSLQKKKKNDAFELMTLPEGRKAFGEKWVHALEENAERRQFHGSQRNSQQWPNQHLRLNILNLPPLFQGTYTRHNYSIVWTTESRVVQQSVETTRVQSR